MAVARCRPLLLLLLLLEGVLLVVVAGRVVHLMVEAVHQEGHLVEVPWVEAVHREAVQMEAAVHPCLVGRIQGVGRQLVGGHRCCLLLLLLVVVVLEVVGAWRILGGHQVGDLGGLGLTLLPLPLLLLPSPLLLLVQVPQGVKVELLVVVVALGV